VNEIAPVPEAAPLLPERFAAFFARRGWRPREHQVRLLDHAARGRSTLLIAPTGAGKTLAGFLPSLVALDGAKRPAGAGPHTLYVSPLKALATDVARNLEAPVAEMGLAVRIETRTGDTPAHKRQRQRIAPPDILLTTPEQVALLIASKGADRLFAGLDTIILDELHALVTSKRGDLLSLGLARLRTLSPGLKAIGLSATVADPEGLAAWLMPQAPGLPPARADIIEVAGGARPDIRILESQERLPWAGHTARYALNEVLAEIAAHRLTIVFVNTRWQAETLFQDLWRANEGALPIALHHGSLDRSRRRRVEEAMAAGELKAVIATSTLDLGLDWGDVDLVIHYGAPKGASRLAQRIGRANHRMDEPSRGLLVPANRFEVIECRAALDANYLGAQDTPPLKPGALDVLCQHILGMAVAGPFDADALYAEVTSALPYAGLDRESFEEAVDFVATGGYSLRAYERFARIRRRADGRLAITHPRVAQQYRLNIGTIIEAPALKVRLVRERKGGAPLLRGGAVLGTIEEGFLESLAKGDTFQFAGETLRFLGLRENEAFVTKAPYDEPRVPAYAGSKFPLTTFLAKGVREIIAEPEEWRRLPSQVADWLALQARRSALPEPDDLLVETFPRKRRSYMAAYPFEGRIAHQTLGMLLTRRLERARLRPLGFVANDYALAVYGLRDLGDAFEQGAPALDALFDEDMLGDDLEAWLDDSYLYKRSFRACATIAGLIERRHPGAEKTGRQMTVSSDLIYDVLRIHEPDHILMKATRADAAAGLLDIRRLGDMLRRIRGKIVHQRLHRVSPLAVPVILEIGRERVAGEAQEDLIAEAAGLPVEGARQDEGVEDAGLESLGVAGGRGA